MTAEEEWRQIEKMAREQRVRVRARASKVWEYLRAFWHGARKQRAVLKGGRLRNAAPQGKCRRCVPMTLVSSQTSLATLAHYWYADFAIRV